MTATPLILLAEDDAEDRDLTHRALRSSSRDPRIEDAPDGRAVMRILRLAADAAPGAAPLPGLVLLDLRMPHQDGFSVLREIRADARLRSLPIVILSTSENPDDVHLSYTMGANSYVSKPVGIRRFAEAMETLLAYWFSVVELPTAPAVPADPAIRGATA